MKGKTTTSDLLNSLIKPNSWGIMVLTSSKELLDHSSFYSVYSSKYNSLKYLTQIIYAQNSRHPNLFNIQETNSNPWQE